MKKLALALLFVLAAFAGAQEYPNFTVVPATIWTAKGHQVSGVALTRIKTFEHIPVIDSIDLDAFGGITLGSRAPVGGFALVKCWSLQSHIWLMAGAAIQVQQHQAVDAGVLLGIMIH